MEMVFTDGTHLIAESISELHAFAKSIDLNRCWFHSGSRHPHYDLMSGKNIQNRNKSFERAKSMGAILVPTRTLIKISRRCYFFPETDEELIEFERRNKWELSQPLSKKEEDFLEKTRKELIDKLFHKNK